MKKIAIIPARGGSKRIPRKNIRDFLGKPIIAYSIETALRSGLFDMVLVSTDDAEIAKIAQDYGAVVPFMRSKKSADDFASLADVIEEVLLTLATNKQNFDVFCCILPTAPFLSATHLKQAYSVLEQGAETVCPVVKYSFPIQRALHIQKQKVSFIQPEYTFTRSQDLPPAYHDCGQFYWGRPESFLKTKSLFTQNTGTIILPETHVQDIDTIDDWNLAELKYTYLHSSKR